MKVFEKISSNKNELLDAVYLIVLQGINQLLPLFVMPYLMLKLGAGGYGGVGYALAVVQYVDLVVTFGFNLSATKLIAQNRERKNICSSIFWNVFSAKMLLLLCTLLLLGLCVEMIPSMNKYSLVIYATLPMAIGSAFTFMWFFQGMGYIRIFSVINTISKLMLLPLIFLFVQSEEDVLYAAFFQALVFVSTAIISNIYLYHKNLLHWSPPSWKGICEVVKDSFPLFLSSASTSVYTQLFVVVLGFYCTSEMIGRYTSAERIMRACVFLLYIPVSQVFYPHISRMMSGRVELARQGFKNVLLLMCGLMAAVAAVLYFVGPYLANWLGETYAGLESLLRIMAFAPLFIGAGGIVGQIGLIAMGTDKDKIHFRNVYFVVSAVSVVLVLILVPAFYEYGAAWALVISEFLVLLLMTYYYLRKV